MNIPLHGPVGSIIGYLLLMQWVLGVVIAQGFWQTLFTLFPPYGVYVSTEYLAKFTGLL